MCRTEHHPRPCWSLAGNSEYCLTELGKTSGHRSWIKHNLFSSEAGVQCTKMQNMFSRGFECCSKRQVKCSRKFDHHCFSMGYVFNWRFIRTNFLLREKVCDMLCRCWHCAVLNVLLCTTTCCRQPSIPSCQTEASTQHVLMQKMKHKNVLYKMKWNPYHHSFEQKDTFLCISCSILVKHMYIMLFPLNHLLIFLCF